jgi:PAS domain S-box-containing protein
MALLLTEYRIALVAAGILSLFIIYLAVGNREKQGVRPLLVMCSGAVIWIAVKLAVSMVRGTPAVLYVARLNTVGSSLTVVGLFLFAIEYSGYEVPGSKRTTAILLIEPAVVNFLVWVDIEYLWRPVGRTDTTLTGYAWEWTTIGQLHVVCQYSVMLVGLLLLIRFAIQSAKIYRNQTVAILVAIVLPLSSSFAFALDYTRLNPVPIGFSISALALSWAIYRARFLDIAPIGRSAIIDDLYAGVLIFDREHRLVDINAQGRRICGFDDSELLIGRHVSDLLTDRPELEDVYWTTKSGEADREYEIAFDGRYYSVEMTPLQSGSEQLLGRSFLVREITGQKQREQELERKNERLERFASIVSHDLRNPLNVIQGHAELARTADRDVDGHLDSIASNTERIEDIIEDMLVMTREGDTQSREPVDIASIVQQAWDHVDTFDATLEVETELTVEGTPTRLVQVFENLFRNAVEHGSTSPDSQARQDAVEHGGDDVTITVGPLTDDGTVTGFFVADDGPGIPEAERDQILEDGYTKSEDGTGLGLSIVTEIVDSHGWEMRVTDSATGGARFDIDCRTGPVESAPVRSDSRPTETH